MTDGLTTATLERLRAVDWSGDWDYAFGHAQSRRLLMHEHLRRSALWARACGAEDAWPFFDVTGYVDPGFQLPSELAAELHEVLKKAAYSARKTCSGAVRFAELRAQGNATLPDLPDPYEPLILFYERGGEYLQDDAGFLDLTGVSIKPRSLQDHLVAMPFLTFRTTTLDALDGEGSISYYATTDRRGPVLRRRLLRGAEQRDEAFTHNWRWEPTEQLQLSEQERTDVYVQIGDIEAARLIETAQGVRYSG
ncbi:hypothetical protein [Streptomyces spiramyceticus]|uniref:hypothetical protein n=1 Tax=Streptomyces spiramyceticus TaxID=299717 RepID=UPI00237B7D3D|nr:hypothetical protein [Streptomyces spiramyceticus]